MMYFTVCFDHVHTFCVCNCFLICFQLIPWPQPGWLSSWTQDFTAACAACSLRRCLSSGCWKRAIFSISVILYPWKQVYRKCIVFSTVMASTFPLLWLLLLLELPLWSNTTFFSPEIQGHRGKREWWRYHSNTESGIAAAAFGELGRETAAVSTVISELWAKWSSQAVVSIASWARQWCDATASGKTWLLGVHWGNIV